jgi:hypothetical protein
MSTQFYTQDQPATSQQDTGHRAPRPHGDGPSWFRIATIAIGTVVAAARPSRAPRPLPRRRRSRSCSRNSAS